jgi:hypothetical protein
MGLLNMRTGSAVRLLEPTSQPSVFPLRRGEAPKRGPFSSDATASPAAEVMTGCWTPRFERLSPLRADGGTAPTHGRLPPVLILQPEFVISPAAVPVRLRL